MGEVAGLYCNLRPLCHVLALFDGYADNSLLSRHGLPRDVIIRLWVLAWAARYLKYVPIIGWRFSETIVESIEDRMDRDVEVEGVSIELADDSPPTESTVSIEVTNQLPVDLTVSAVNVRLGYEENGSTVANVLWTEDAHGEPPDNISRSLIESETTETATVERYLTGETADETLYVDGSVTTRAWLDIPSTRRIPLGTLQRSLPEKHLDLST